MITSELKDGVVWLTVEGELTSQDVAREVGRWLPQKDTISGFITDLRLMTSVPSTEVQKELEEWRKQNRTGKPHAMLGRTNALSVLVTIYMRLTQAQDTRYFMNPEAAVDWVKSHDRE